MAAGCAKELLCLKEGSPGLAWSIRLGITLQIRTIEIIIVIW